MIRKSFDKKENWDSITFYKIYEENGKKYFQITSETDRGFDPKYDYMLYIFRTYSDNYKCSLSELLEWDIDWKLSKIRKEQNIKTHEEYFDPPVLFEKVNKLLVEGDENGTRELRIHDLDLETPCGYYFCECGY